MILSVRPKHENTGHALDVQPAWQTATMQRIFHIIEPATWNRLQGASHYSAPSLADEGFIHASTSEQLAGTLARHYAGREDLKILELDIAELDCDLRWEMAGDRGPYPHLYGPMALAAVVRVHEQTDLVGG